MNPEKIKLAAFSISPTFQRGRSFCAWPVALLLLVKKRHNGHLIRPFVNLAGAAPAVAVIVIVKSVDFFIGNNISSAQWMIQVPSWAQHLKFKTGRSSSRRRRSFPPGRREIWNLIRQRVAQIKPGGTNCSFVPSDLNQTLEMFGNVIRSNSSWSPLFGSWRTCQQPEILNFSLIM